MLSEWVDFHTEIGSETYDFSIGGGGYALISELVNVLGLASDDPNTEEAELRLFVEQITNVTFTASELVNVSKAEKNTTIGISRKPSALNANILQSSHRRRSTRSIRLRYQPATGPSSPCIPLIPGRP